MRFKALMLCLGFLGAPLAASDSVALKQSFELAKKASLDNDHPLVIRSWLISAALVKENPKLTRPKEFLALLNIAVTQLKLCPDLVPEEDAYGLWSILYFNYIAQAMDRRSDRLKSSGWTNSMETHTRDMDLESSLSLEEWKKLRFEPRSCNLKNRIFKRAIDFNRLIRMMGPDGSFQHLKRLQRLKILESLIFQVEYNLSPEVARQNLIKAKHEQINIAIAKDLQSTPEHFGKSRLEDLSPKDWATLDSVGAQTLWAERLRLHESTQFEGFVLQVIDELLKAKKDEPLMTWLSLIKADKTKLWRGDRAKALLGAKGFKERATIALYRAYDALVADDVSSCLKSLAEVQSYLNDSSEAQTIYKHRISMLFYIATKYRLSQEFLDYLNTYIEPELKDDIFVRVAWAAYWHRDPLTSKFLEFSTLSASLRGSKPYFESARNFSLKKLLREDLPQRGRFKLWVGQYLRNLEAEPLQVIREEKPNLEVLAQSFAKDKFWGQLAKDFSETLARIDRRLASAAVSQGLNDLQSLPVSLGGKSEFPVRPEVWPFNVEVRSFDRIEPIFVRAVQDPGAPLGFEIWEGPKPL